MRFRGPKRCNRRGRSRARRRVAPLVALLLVAVTPSWSRRRRPAPPATAARRRGSVRKGVPAHAFRNDNVEAGDYFPAGSCRLLMLSEKKNAYRVSVG
ncbi:MAG TPA: hypothetical protein VEG38_19010 [Acidimicrobiia bacterium]|nr:hypothetical protein [Acidimicrobiia bacterium]